MKFNLYTDSSEIKNLDHVCLYGSKSFESPRLTINFLCGVQGLSSVSVQSSRLSFSHFSLYHEPYISTSLICLDFPECILIFSLIPIFFLYCYIHFFPSLSFLVWFSYLCLLNFYSFFKVQCKYPFH